MYISECDWWLPTQRDPARKAPLLSFVLMPNHATTSAGPEARPRPHLSPIGQTRAEWVSLNGTQEDQQVVLLEWDGTKENQQMPLVDVPGMVEGPIAAD